jgi:transcriptional regulator with XRE-family HTH domain
MTRRGDFIQIGERLRLTRQALGMTQAAFAKHVGIARNTFNQYESLSINQRYRAGLHQANELL